MLHENSHTGDSSTQKGTQYKLTVKATAPAIKYFYDVFNAVRNVLHALASETIR